MDIQTFEFSVLDRKYPFWANLAQKIKIVSLSWNLVFRPIRICRIHWRCSLCLFLIRNTLFRYRNCQFELKFGTFINLNMQNSMMVLTFSIFDRKYLFWGKFGPKNQNCQFELKFGSKANSNMRNSMAVLAFSGFNQKYLFWANLVQEIDIFSLS